MKHFTGKTVRMSIWAEFDHRELVRVLFLPPAQNKPAKRRAWLLRLWHGATWRTINITATVYIANEGCNRLPPYITALTRSETRTRS